MSSHSCNWFFEIPVKEVILKDDNKRGRLTEIAGVHVVTRLYIFMTQKLEVSQGNKSMWRLVVFTWCYSCLQINLHVHVNNTVHVYFQVSQGMATIYTSTIYMQVSQQSTCR